MIGGMTASQPRVDDGRARRGRWQYWGRILVINSLATILVATVNGALAGALCLNRRARHRTKGTEYAAIAWLCLQLFAATGAFIEKLTGICRHRLGFRDGAMRTYECRLKKHRFNFGF